LHEAAQVAVTKLQRQVDEDRHPKTGSTVRQAIAQWLEVADLADTTRERYEDLIRLHILPTLGDRPADRVDAEVLERLYARLQRCRDLCVGRPSPGSRLPATERQHGTKDPLHAPDGVT
jgi:integrase